MSSNGFFIDDRMMIGRREETIFPQTEKGKKMAVEYAERLKSRGEYTGWMEDSVQIIVKSYTQFSVWEGTDDAEE